MQKQFIGITALAIVATLAACGGGGGTTTPATNPPTPTPTPTTGSTTNASGTVVDDGTGTAIAGATVKLMPWAPCAATPVPSTSITPENDGCPTPMPSPQATTNAQGQFTLNGAPNGHYLLVIGADAISTPPAGYAPPTCTTSCGTPTPAPFTVQATIHDNVTLTGGNQTLKAPTLPSVPEGYTAPTWETNGDYRLATLNESTEMPCYIAWQYQRGQNSLAGASVDEWLTENERANLAYAAAYGGGAQFNLLTTANGFVAGGTNCDSWVEGGLWSGNAYASNPRVLWFGAAWSLVEFPGLTFYQGSGFAQYPTDPRSFTDPNFPTWP